MNTPGENNNGEKWVALFNRECTQSTIGDSGIGGNTPTDPDYYINVEPQDVIAFIKEHFIYKDDLIGLVEGIANEKRKYAQTQPMSTMEGNWQNALLVEHVTAYNRALEDFATALKDTLSNQP